MRQPMRHSLSATDARHMPIRRMHVELMLQKDAMPRQDTHLTQSHTTLVYKSIDRNRLTVCLVVAPRLAPGPIDFQDTPSSFRFSRSATPEPHHTLRQIQGSIPTVASAPDT